MSFHLPQWLWALAALPLLAAWMLWAHRLRRQRIERYAEPALWNTVAREVSWSRLRWRIVLRLAALAFLILALARPGWGLKERPLVREGSDLIICLDVSTSMLATDIAPSRLERAKSQVKALIRNLRGDRVGLVVFAGEAYVQCPLTLDYALAARLLDMVGTDSVAVQGTRIGGAIETARQAFDRSALGAKSILLITDGEDQGSEPFKAAERAAEEGILLMTVGIGTSEGMPIRLPDGTYKEDRQHRKVTSRLDAETLRKIASISGGKALVTDASGEMKLDELYETIRGLQKTRFEGQEVTLLEERFQWPLGFAIGFLALELLLGLSLKSWIRLRVPLGLNRRGEGQRPIISTAGPFLLVAAGFGALMPAHAQAFSWDFGNRAARLCEEGNRAYDNEDFDRAVQKYLEAQSEVLQDPHLKMNEGLALAQQGKLDDASAALKSAALAARNDPKTRAKALYNQGTIHWQAARHLKEQRQYDKAIEHAEQAVDLQRESLKFDPSLGKAQRNLDEARQLLRDVVVERELQPPPPPQCENQPSQDDQSDSQDQQKKQEDSSKADSSESNENQDSQAKENQSSEKDGDQQQDPSKASAENQEEKEKESAASPGESDQQTDEEKSGDTHQVATGEESKEGEMTRRDAILLLSTLGEEDPDALKKALRPIGATLTLEKDW